MTLLEQLRKANKRKDRIYKLTHLNDKKCAALTKVVGEELYGKPGDKIEFIQGNGTPGIGKILYTEPAMWTDIPRCIIEAESPFSGKQKTYINGPEKILRRL